MLVGACRACVCYLDRLGGFSAFRPCPWSGRPMVITIQHGDAGDAVTVASPMLKNWPLFGQKFSKFGKVYSYIHM